MGIKQADFVSAFARGLEIIKLFSDERPTVSVSEAAALVKGSRAAVRRLLLTLVELGYAEQNGDAFQLTPRVLELGYSYLSTWNISRLVEPHLRDVVSQLHENCSLGALDGDSVVYIARAEARRIVQTVDIAVGSRLPAAQSSMGRVLLALLPEDEAMAIHARTVASKSIQRPMISAAEFRASLQATRERGWALLNQEFEPGLLSIAVPVRANDGTVIGAINVGAPSTRASLNDLSERFLPVLQDAGEKISASLAKLPSSSQKLIR